MMLKCDQGRYPAMITRADRLGGVISYAESKDCGKARPGSDREARHSDPRLEGHGRRRHEGQRLVSARLPRGGGTRGLGRDRPCRRHIAGKR